MLRCCHIALFLLCLGAGALYAQTPETTVVSGLVMDADTGAPLPGAHVIVAGSQQGTVTDAEGRYQLDAVPLGAMRLYASMLGFEPLAVDTVARATNSYRFSFALSPAVVVLDDVTVTAERDDKWPGRLKAFERDFLGTSRNADSTRILNPEVLSFAGGLNYLQAWASEPLHIENRALGYHITYFLHGFVQDSGELRFSGEPLYEPLVAASPEEAARWATNRETAYYGSLPHFLQTLLHGSTRKAGFRTAKRPALDYANSSTHTLDLAPRHLLADDPAPDLSLLDFSGFVEVVYHEEHETEAYQKWQGLDARGRPEPQRSWIQLTDGPARIDHYGAVVDPYGVTTYGFFAFERVADQLPKEYRPPSETP